MFTKKLEPFAQRVWLTSPTMHGDELKYIAKGYTSNWMSTVGENINEVEHIAAEKAGMKYAVGLTCCTAALHLCVKMAGEQLYGSRLLGMSNVIAGVILWQCPYLEEHIAQRRPFMSGISKKGVKGLPITMNPFDPEKCEPNY